VKKALTTIALILAAYWVIKNPVQAAALVHQVTHALATLAASL
jgi:hypothetical protein